MQNNSNWNLHTNNLWIIIKLFPFEWRSEENLFRWFCAFFFSLLIPLVPVFFLVVVVFVPSSDTSETGITGNRKSLELDCLRINILFNFLGENYHTVNKIRERPRECGWAGEKFIERICVWFLHWIGLFSVLYWVALRWSHTRKKTTDENELSSFSLLSLYSTTHFLSLALFKLKHTHTEFCSQGSTTFVKCSATGRTIREILQFTANANQSEDSCLCIHSLWSTIATSPSALVLISFLHAEYFTKIKQINELCRATRIAIQSGYTIFPFHTHTYTSPWVCVCVCECANV